MRHTLYSIMVVVLSLLSPAVRGQGFAGLDVDKYHLSSVYYLTLDDGTGANISDRYTAEGLLGAFVGGELRGVAKAVYTPGGTVFLMRVWGDESDPATMDVHLWHGELEYVVGRLPFNAGDEASYGSPSQPTKLTLVPVTGVELSPASISISMGRTQNVEARLVPQNHSELVTPVDFRFSSSDATIASVVSTEGSYCRIDGKQRGTSTLNVQVSTAGGKTLFSAAAPVSVLTETVPVTGIRNDMASDDIKVTEGDDFSLRWTLLPENATNRDVNITIADNTLLYYIEGDMGQHVFHAVKAGVTTVTVASVSNPEVKLVYHVTIEAAAVPEPTHLSFAQKSYTLSKLRDTGMTVVVEGDYDANRLSLVFSTAPDGGPAAVATPADSKRLAWTVRGLSVGSYKANITYDGKVVGDACQIDIPAEVTFENGWDWISLFTSTPFPLLTDAGDYIATLNMDAKNRVEEIRSQQAAVKCDPQLGLFGDLTRLSAADGAYKVKSTYEERNAAAKVINLGLTPGSDATATQMPMIEPGYTWIGYPHEQNHSLAALQKYIAANANEGDVIIGRDDFIEFDGLMWVGSLKTFEAGKGYIYYTESTKPFRLDWGSYYLPREENLSLTAPAAARSMSPWHYNARQYPSSMPVVARLADAVGADGVTVGAFVGGECRGLAVVADDDRLFLSVTGLPGERVSFRLYDEASGQSISLNETVIFGAPQGSLRAPLRLSGNTVGIRVAESTALTLSFDGSSIIVGGAAADKPLTVSVRTLDGRTVLTANGTTVSISQLPTGVYAVTAVSGAVTRTIKIAK